MAEHQKERRQVLTRLANAVSERPLDQHAVREAALELETKLGREALVEAAGVCGAFEGAFTKIADATGKDAQSAGMLKAIELVMGTATKLQSWFYY